LPAVIEHESERVAYGNDFRLDVGDVLCPDLISKSTLVGDRYPVELGGARKRLGPYWWGSLYKGNPTPLEGGIFKSHWFRFYGRIAPSGFLVPRAEGEHAIDPWSLYRFGVADLASSMKESADYVVFSMWGFEKKRNRLYLLDVIRDRIDGGDKMPILKDLMGRWRVKTTWIESTQFQLDFVQRARRNGLGSRELEAEGDKVGRALSATPMLEGAQVWFPEAAAWLEDWLIELTRFPKADHDDQADVLAYACILAQSPAFQSLSALPPSLDAPKDPQKDDEPDPRGVRDALRSSLEHFAPTKENLGDAYPRRP
jgi:predicted phage terminase large subunit-like protein